MKAFDEMSTEEQRNWWLEQARQALNNFDTPNFNMPDAQIEWLAFTHNPVFEVINGKKHYVLRMHRKDDNALSLLGGEMFVLQHLQKEEVAAPVIIDIAELSNTMGTLFTKMEGVEQIPSKLTIEEAKVIGNYLAKLHKLEFPYVRTRPRLDFDGIYSKYGYYPLTEEILRCFSPEQVSVMDTIAEKVKQAMEELGQGEDEFGLIHGDLLLKNILFHEGEVRALDFEYCGWGYYLYDLTPLLWQLKPQERYLQLEQALWDGYTNIRPLTKRHRELLETFIAGRQVASMRWIAANQQNPHVVGKVETILKQRTAELQDFLETRILNRR